MRRCPGIRGELGITSCRGSPWRGPRSPDLGEKGRREKGERGAVNWTTGKRKAWKEGLTLAGDQEKN